MVPLIASSEVQSALREAAAAHRHLCPRQVLGVRMGVYAGELLELALPQTGKRLYTFVETDGCFVDGITAATACSLGHRTLRLMDYGKVAATFVDTETARAIRISPSPDSRRRAVEYAPAAPNRWRAQLAAYQTMPAAELLCYGEVELTLDLNASIGKPGVRVNCSQCGEEILNLREVHRNGRVLCQACACGSYARARRVEETG
jgi:formylmethanofuran dehydrogenase subunit E